MDLSKRTFIGTVVKNDDPLKKCRVKIHVVNIFDNIEIDAIPWASPWKDLNGNSNNIPEIGKIVNVVFDNGNLYTPEYIYAQHYNINLQKKLEALEGTNYLSMKSLIFDHNTQIYVNEEEGLKIDHVYSNMNIDKNGNINHNLRDNNSKLNLGSPDASQQAMLGNHWMDWFDDFISELLGENGGPYLGNLGSPVIAHPKFIEILTKYRAIRETFLSDHVWVVDDQEVLAQKRDAINQQGDDIKSTKGNKSLVKKSPNSYTPEDRPENGRADIKDSSVPGNIQQANSAESVSTINGKPISGDYENGKIPQNKMKKSTWLAKSLGGDAALLVPEAADALNEMMIAYEAAKFNGKQKIVFTDGYRSYERQVALYNKYGAGRAAKPGTSNHGWGVAIDMYWGVRTEMFKDNEKRPSGFKHPVYRWFLENGWKYGWYNPSALRDDSKTDEYWHWEFRNKKEVQTIIAARYKGDFTDQDIANIKKSGGSYIS